MAYVGQLKGNPFSKIKMLKVGLKNNNFVKDIVPTPIGIRKETLSTFFRTRMGYQQYQDLVTNGKSLYEFHTIKGVGSALLAALQIKTIAAMLRKKRP